MAAKYIAVCCLVFNVANSQIINLPGPFPGQLLPGLLPNQILPGQVISGPLLPPPILPGPVISGPLPSQVIINPPLGPIAPPCLPTPNIIGIDLPGYGLDAVYSAPVTVPATTTIIQDSTVANNLANALQLLIVSNLLSNTLPAMGSPEVVVPGLPALPALPAGYTYVY